ncbi:PREDICTED: serine protease gd-like isoform X2 [Dinoponera quadriceps]|uniref:Serine protease gd-like isoform X2 n=1 Tax=Dinoponera quadriceps TaxID=609295 RepID=A0A6P3XXZ3_DINQU|nr:PREDICTED: serine protease gd-like isoform X2 [Dinoponera quadriceps]
MQQLVVAVACTAIALVLIISTIIYTHFTYSAEPKENRTDFNALQSQPKLPPDYKECGRSFVYNETDALTRGMNDNEEQWTWLALFFKRSFKKDIKCIGSLVTKRHVLTLATCFMKNDSTMEKIDPSEMLVRLGRYWRTNSNEAGYVYRDIANYTIHPNYTQQTNSNLSKYVVDSDLAVAVLRTSVEYSSMIKPICLWTYLSNLQDMFEISGFIVSWPGSVYYKGEFNLLRPTVLKIQMEDQMKCKLHYRDLASLDLKQTICAGTKNAWFAVIIGTGNSLVIRDSATGHYLLRGILTTRPRFKPEV